MAYDDTSAYPERPHAPEPARARQGLVRLYLVVQLALALFLFFYSALLAASTFLPILAGRGADPINIFLLTTWSLAGILCACRCISACWSVLARASRGEA